MDRPPRAQAITVLGMHRSGTSCLAGALQFAGLYAGKVVEKARHNRRGNRENLEIQALHDDVLAASGGSWDDPPEKLTWADEHSRRRNELIARFSAESPVWMFKDPRTLLVFDFWRRADVELVPIGIFRHPGRVASSLTSRSEMPTARGLRLWRLYNLILRDVHRADAFPLLCFDASPASFDAQLHTAIEILGRKLAHAVELLSETASTFFSEELVHNTANTPELPGGLAAEAAERVARLLAGDEHLYAWLERRSLLT